MVKGTSLYNKSLPKISRDRLIFSQIVNNDGKNLSRTLMAPTKIIANGSLQHRLTLDKNKLKQITNNLFQLLRHYSPQITASGAQIDADKVFAEKQLHLFLTVCANSV